MYAAHDNFHSFNVAQSSQKVEHPRSKYFNYEIK